MMRNISDIAKYLGLSLLSKGLSVSPLKLQKMLYYTQAWYMVFFGKYNTLFTENPQAWVNGPVYPDIFLEYKDKTNDMCEHLRAKDFDCTDDTVSEEAGKLAKTMELTEDEIKCIDSIIMLYGSKSQNQLIFMTHAESPWADQRKGLSPFDYSQREISLESMYHYYKARYEQNHSQDNEI
jgi:uncharacterized phage-associated protein